MDNSHIDSQFAYNFGTSTATTFPTASSTFDYFLLSETPSSNIIAAPNCSYSITTTDTIKNSWLLTGPPPTGDFPAQESQQTFVPSSKKKKASAPSGTTHERYSIANLNKKKSAYKHVPHREKPQHVVARRNARERRRVQAVNAAFVELRKRIPVPMRGKRVSKAKTLHLAIEYIRRLSSILNTETLSDSKSFSSTSDGKVFQIPTVRAPQQPHFRRKSITYARFANIEPNAQNGKVLWNCSSIAAQHVVPFQGSFHHQ